MNHKSFFLIDYLPIVSLLVLGFADLFPGNGTLPMMIGSLCSFPSLLNYIVGKDKSQPISTFMLLAFVGCLFVWLLHPINRRDIFLLVGSFGLAIYSIKHIKTFKCVSFVVIVFLICFLFEKIFIEQIDVNLIYEDSGRSKNYPGFLLVIWMTAYSFVKFATTGKPSLLFPVFGIVLAVFLDGRTSIVLMFTLLLINLFVVNKKISLLMLLIVFIGIFFWWSELQLIYSFSSFETYGLETARWKLWQSYFNHLDLGAIIVGLDTMTVPEIAFYSGNPHNTFLYFHHATGLLGIFGLIYITIKSLRKYLSNHKYILFLYCIIVIVRLFFDSLIFMQTDFIIYFFLFFPFLGFRYAENKEPHREYPRLLKPVMSILSLF